MRNKITVPLADGLALTTSYQNITQPDSFGSVAMKGGQVILTFKRTSGTSITFMVDELFSYLVGGVEEVGWTTRKTINAAGTGLDDIEITETDSAFSFAFTTLADKIRVQAKGAGSEVLDLLMTVGEVQ